LRRYRRGKTKKEKTKMEKAPASEGDRYASEG